MKKRRWRRKRGKDEVQEKENSDVREISGERRGIIKKKIKSKKKRGKQQ